MPDPEWITPEQWPRVAELFDAAFDLPIEDRPSFLERACGGDQALRGHVERMLKACTRADGLLETPASSWVAAIIKEKDETTALPDTRFGPFRAIGVLGRGGMGTVYLAERADGEFEQRVALKVIRAGMDSKEILRRFLSERQIMARLQHANIARLLDGGRSEDGRPWFAMDLVEGEPITTYCDARRLPVDARLELVESVCEAVAHAHSSNIIHRDLKPSNILVTAAGHVQLLDFGIAKLLREGAPSELTLTGFRVMTPDYAAPEQVLSERTTPATDIYAIGAVLYELLTGHRAHEFSRHHPTMEEIERVVCVDAPQPPSVIVTRAAGGVPGSDETSEELSNARGTDPQGLAQILHGELDGIVLTALRKEPDQRYPTVEALLDDLRRYRAGQAIHGLPIEQPHAARLGALQAVLRALTRRR